MINSPRSSRGLKTESYGDTFLCTGQKSVKHTMISDTHVCTISSIPTEVLDNSLLDHDSGITDIVPFKYLKCGIRNRKIRDQADVLQGERVALHIYPNNDGQCIRPAAFFDEFLAKNPSALQENKNQSGGDDILSSVTSYGNANEFKTLINNFFIGDPNARSFSEDKYAIIIERSGMSKQQQCTEGCGKNKVAISDFGKSHVTSTSTEHNKDIIDPNKWFSQELAIEGNQNPHTHLSKPLHKQITVSSAKSRQ